MEDSLHFASQQSWYDPYDTLVLLDRTSDGKNTLLPLNGKEAGITFRTAIHLAITSNNIDEAVAWMKFMIEGGLVVSDLSFHSLSMRSSVLLFLATDHYFSLFQPSSPVLARLLGGLSFRKRYSDSLAILQLVSKYPNAGDTSRLINFAVETLTKLRQPRSAALAVNSLSEEVLNIASSWNSRRLRYASHSGAVPQMRSWRWEHFFPLLSQSMAVLSVPEGRTHEASHPPNSSTLTFAQAMESTVLLLRAYLLAHPQPVNTWMTESGEDGFLLRNTLKGLQRLMQEASPEVRSELVKTLQKKAKRGDELLDEVQKMAPSS